MSKILFTIFLAATLFSHGQIENKKWCFVLEKKFNPVSYVYHSDAPITFQGKDKSYNWNGKKGKYEIKDGKLNLKPDDVTQPSKTYKYSVTVSGKTGLLSLQYGDGDLASILYFVFCPDF